jgi:hypothetical protein
VIRQRVLAHVGGHRQVARALLSFQHGHLRRVADSPAWRGKQVAAAQPARRPSWTSSSGLGDTERSYRSWAEASANGECGARARSSSWLADGCAAAGARGEPVDPD